MDLFSLTKTVSSVHRLLIHSWIPVAVVENDLWKKDIAWITPKVMMPQTSTTLSYRVNGYFNSNWESIVKWHLLTSLQIKWILEIDLQNIDHVGHLRVNQHSVWIRFEPFQKHIQHIQFARVGYELLFGRNHNRWPSMGWHGGFQSA